MSRHCYRTSIGCVNTGHGGPKGRCGSLTIQVITVSPPAGLYLPRTEVGGCYTPDHQCWFGGDGWHSWGHRCLPGAPPKSIDMQLQALYCQERRLLNTAQRHSVQYTQRLQLWQGRGKLLSCHTHSMPDIIQQRIPTALTPNAALLRPHISMHTATHHLS